MALADILDTWRQFDFQGYLSSVNTETVEQALSKDKLSEWDFLALLSPAAEPYLESMARKAHEITLRHFGKTIQLYIPLYLSNYCSNHCVYCGFNHANRIERVKLSMAEIEENARLIASSGMKHILILTGEDRKATPLSYLIDAVRVLRQQFPSVSVEVYPMQEEEYAELKMEGVDGLTVYQEVYDQEVYRTVHPAGKKRDYNYRLATPERGARAGLRWVNIGPLFGLTEPTREAFFAGLHARFLQDKFLETEISISLPRLNPAEGDYQSGYELKDKQFVQVLVAYRLFLHRAGLVVSTRESAEFRDRLIPLGITRMSAGSLTEVGGYHSAGKSTGQFEVSDKRAVADVACSIQKAGYEPVYKDWELL